MKDKDFLNELKEVLIKHHKENDVLIEYYTNDYTYWWDGDSFIEDEEIDETWELNKSVPELRTETVVSVPDNLLPPVKFISNKEVL